MHFLSAYPKSINELFIVVLKIYFHNKLRCLLSRSPYEDGLNLRNPEPPKVGSGTGEKKVPSPTSKVALAKYIYPKAENMNLSCRVTWTWPENVISTRDRE